MPIVGQNIKVSHVPSTNRVRQKEVNLQFTVASDEREVILELFLVEFQTIDWSHIANKTEIFEKCFTMFVGIFICILFVFPCIVVDQIIEVSRSRVEVASNVRDETFFFTLDQ